MKTIGLLAIVLFALSSAGCTKVGSEAWCAKMKDTPKGDWTANEAADFAKHCIID
ncbi:MAG: hypothetical protein COA29_02075 [Porticoccus sp.]|jgi:hypothetical protein|uniref:DUF3012 domain-containing protein n=1 Tax=Porticoccus sp. TaxID=2024853 RepID=UPI000C0FECC7|nr:DUF3012 domain-containing protein [Porticoccus sp.]MAZ71506.1 hypothetical protein [Porticoccus sp.]PHQ58108.1 MAG: hypothetical protein COA29_02075 [Porticoccus sp.]|tara:strand:- start:30377 stop:30541 length:165 start_codon:yes stop_codon:yes gene_type:complete